MSTTRNVAAFVWEVTVVLTLGGLVANACVQGDAIRQIVKVDQHQTESINHQSSAIKHINEALGSHSNTLEMILDILKTRGH